MSRFFKSAAFPIIIVVVLAFFAQRLILSNDEPKQSATWSQFVTAAENGDIRYVKTHLEDNSL